MKLKETVTAPIAVLASYILYVICYRTPWVRDALLRNGEYNLLSGIVLELLILLIPALLYAKLKGQGYSAKIHFASLRPSGSILAFCILLIALCGILLIAVGYVASGIIHSKYLLSETYAMLLPERELSVFLRCMNYAIIPAVGEELLYRGILVTELSGGGVGLSIIFSSLLFACSRFDLVSLPVYFFVGLCLSVLFYTTRSLPLTIITRLALNLLIFYFEDAAWTLILKRANFPLLICTAAILLLFAAFLALSEAQRLYYLRGMDGEKTPAEWKLTESRKVRLLSLLLSPSFILCLVTFALVISLM